MVYSTDNAYTYWEWRDNSGGLFEGGMFAHVDSSINPYLSASIGGNLHNGGARFQCNSTLAMMAGLVPGSPVDYYVAIGSISNYVPANAFAQDETVNIQNTAWTFATAPGDVDHPGIDPAGVSTPCTTCSITQVASIAQKPENLYNGSYFAVNNGEPALHFYELFFGQWQPGCNGQLCQITYPSNPDVYFGGIQSYPSSDYADAQKSPANTVYEVFEGVVLGDIENAFARHPQSDYVVPPPPSCGLDGYGFCVASSVLQQSTTDCRPQDDGYGTWVNETLGNNTYLVLDSHSVLRTYQDAFVDDGSGNCQSVESWYPSEPSQTTGDPNLP